MDNLNGDHVDCPESNNGDNQQPLTLNPRYEREDQPDNLGFFYDLQYAITGQNGQQSFISTPMGTVNLGNAVSNYATSNNMTRAQVLALGDDKLKEIYDAYKEGRLLSGELKKYTIEKLENFLVEHQKNRIKAKKEVKKFLAKL